MGLLQRLLSRKTPQKPTPVKPLVGINCLYLDYPDLDHLQILKVRHVRISHDLSDQHTLAGKLQRIRAIGADPLVSVWNLPIDWSPAELAGCLIELVNTYPEASWQLDMEGRSLGEYLGYYRDVSKAFRRACTARLLPAGVPVTDLRIVAASLSDTDVLCATAYVDDPEGTRLAEAISDLRQAAIGLDKYVWITSFGSTEGTPAASELTAALQMLPIGWRGYYHALRDPNYGARRSCPRCEGTGKTPRGDLTIACSVCSGLGTLSVERGLVSFENQTCFPAFQAVKDWITPNRKQASVRIKD